MSLIALSVVKNSVGQKNRVKWHVNEIVEVGRVMTQEQCLLSQSV